MIDPITSIRNPLIQRLRSLKDRKGREAEGLFLVEGEKLIGEAIHAGLRVHEALIQQDRLRAFDGLAGALDHAGASTFAVPRHVLEAVCDTMTPSGACAAFEPPQGLDPEHPPEKLVALDALADPGNVGTIWRTADAAGFQGLILGDGCCDPLSPKVQRAAMGSAFRLPIFQARPLGEALAGLKGKGYTVVTSELSGDDIYARGLDFDRFVLVIGSEARGVSAEVSEIADRKLKLPMRGGAESLNAAVAAGILMYELTRRR